MNNQGTMAKNIPTESKSWTWRQVLSNSLRNSNDNSVQALLSQGNISFSQVYGWLTAALMIFQIFSSIIFWIRFSFPVNLVSILDFVKDCLLVGLLGPASFVAFTGLIHILAKLFRGKGTFQQFFITYIAYNIRPGISYGITVLIWQASGIKFVVYLGVLLSFYVLLVPITKAIKVNYHFRWIGAFLIGFLAQVIFLLSFIGIFKALQG